MLTDRSIESVLLVDLKRLIVGNVSNDDFQIINQLASLPIAQNVANSGTAHFSFLLDGQIKKLCVVALRQAALSALLYTVVRYNDDFLRGVHQNQQFPNRVELVLARGDFRVLAETVVAEDGDRVGTGTDVRVGAENRQTERYRNVSEYGWVVDGYPMARQADDANEIRRYALVSSIGILAILTGLSVTIYLNITKPVASLARFIEKYGKSYNHERIHIPYKNEVGILADSVNRMLDEIQQFTRRIVDSQGRR
jgi:methyl-accepting chemotaxis protein